MQKHTVRSFETLRRSQFREWSTARGKDIAPPGLPKHVKDLLAEWFELVDTNSTKRVSIDELREAFKVSASNLEPVTEGLAHPRRSVASAHAGW